MKVLMVASEAFPFAKSGGLADVLFSLSSKLVERRQKVTIVIPLYQEVLRHISFEALELFASFEVQMSWRKKRCDVYRLEYKRITYLFIDQESYFMRDKLYGYDDDIERFSFFTMAIKGLIINKNLHFDIIHIHDWHGGMLPLVMRDYEVRKKKFKYVFTIHNIAYQGICAKEKLGDYLNLDDYYFDSGVVRFNGEVNFMKAALVTCDKITTVSLNYAKEILNGKYDYGLQPILKMREKDIVGILNGIDYKYYNPKSDHLLPLNYGLGDFVLGKKRAKAEIIKKFGLKDEERPLFAIVTRLTFQKGIELVNDVIPTLVKTGANVIVLGTGEYNLENQLSFLYHEHPEHLYVHIGFDEDEAHLIYAASDFFLMPSLFEPCGIGQLIALRYGALPIVRPVGGLADTVIGYTGLNPNTANGLYIYHYSLSAFESAIGMAFNLYKNKTLFKKLSKNALKARFDWKISANKYLELYRLLVN